jgi:hypothetical protein
MGTGKVVPRYVSSCLVPRMKEAEGEAGGAGILYLILLPQGVYLFSSVQAKEKRYSDSFTQIQYTDERKFQLFNRI